MSDTLPLEPACFDVVIFDEASQIPLEEAIPALYRSHQVIVVGDEMQLPPTKFFASARGEDDSIFVLEEGRADRSRPGFGQLPHSIGNEPTEDAARLALPQPL